MKKKFSLCISVLLGIMTSLVLAANSASERIAVKYLKTSDGDTARVELNGENVRVRFLGINTPEVSGENKVEEPFGNEALAYTKNKLDHAKKVEIEYDTVADQEDRFGRKLAWIWIDDELFELELLEQGLAKTYMLKNDYKYASELKAAEKKAKEAKVGVWSETETSNKENTSHNADEPENSAKTQEKTEMTNSSVMQEKAEEHEEANFQWESYGIVVVIIFIILLILKNKRK